ncbi:MAG: DUF1194 domain-containing protein [Alphaproteobacteria bacterium]|nr:DUF1194 domain-containing protein [Alphaproteobacteria bacterium]
MRLLYRILGAASLAAAAITPAASPQQQREQVDVELVLAVDISQSMDYDEHTLQRMGYVDAFRHKDVGEAIRSGPEGKIAVTYMEWGGDFEPIVLIPWTIIDGPESARAFADKLANEQISSLSRTSISNALYSAADLIDKNDITSHRRVIDVSGDGPNNAGPPVEQARDDVVKRGFTVNGLPIMLERPKEFYDIDHLDRYYKQCVIGGQGSFIAPVFDLQQLAGTVRKKLVLEIAGNEVNPPGTAPVEYASATPAPAPGASPLKVQLKLPTEKMDCFAGEKAMGGGRFGGFGRFPR